MTIDNYLISFFLNQAPIVICLWKFNNLKRAQKIFGFFLLWGALIDIKYYLPLSDAVHDKFYLIFVLTEIVFYWWFISAMAPNIIRSKIKNAILLSIQIFWFLATFILEDSSDNDSYSGLYDGFSAVLLSSYAALAIFKLTQGKIPLERIPDFWFMSGIFFYFFCSVFIFSIMSKQVAEGAWMVHRLINTATMFVFAYGFYLAGKKPVLTQPK